MSYFIDVHLESGDNLHLLDNQNLLPLTKNGMHSNFQKRVRIRFYEPNTTSRLLYNQQFNPNKLILCFEFWDCLSNLNKCSMILCICNAKFLLDFLLNANCVMFICWSQNFRKLSTWKHAGLNLFWAGWPEFELLHRHFRAWPKCFYSKGAQMNTVQFMIVSTLAKIFFSADSSLFFTYFSIRNINKTSWRQQLADGRRLFDPRQV